MNPKNQLPKQDLWALMCPDEDQLLRESLDMSDEEVEASLEARGYDLEKLNTELLALVDRLPRTYPKKRGYVALAALAVVMALCASTTYALIAARAPVETEDQPPTTAAAPLPPQDSADNGAGWESARGHHP